MRTLFEFIRDIFRMPVIWWPWMVGLPLVNLAAVFFLPRPEAWAVLLTGFAAATIMTVLHAKLGYVRFIGVGHFVWIPMLVWLVTRLNAVPKGTFRNWILLLIIMDTGSLILDTVDLIRYLRGERIPLFK